VSLAGGTAANRNETVKAKANAKTTVRFPIDLKVRPVMGLHSILHFYRRMASKIKSDSVKLLGRNNTSGLTWSAAFFGRGRAVDDRYDA
jgi:hypothetical protein